MTLLFLILCVLMWSEEPAAAVCDSALRSVKVKEGDDVTLPCDLGPKTSQDKGFDWKKDGFTILDKLDNDNPTSTNKRVSFFNKPFESRKASIKISSAQRSDSGLYTCVRLHGSHSTDECSRISLTVECILKDRTGEKVKDTCPEPNILEVKDTNGGVLVECKAKGASQNPEMELVDSSGHPVPPESVEYFTNGTMILHAVVTKTDSYHCVVKQNEFCHQLSSEQIVVNVPGSDTVWIVVVTLIVSVAVVVFSISVCCVIKSKKKLNPGPEGQQDSMLKMEKETENNSN